MGVAAGWAAADCPPTLLASIFPTTLKEEQVTKSEFVDQVADRAGLSKKDAGDAVDAMLETIEGAIPKHRRGVKPSRNREIISGVIHVLKVGCRCVDYPSVFGPHTTAKMGMVSCPDCATFWAAAACSQRRFAAANPIPGVRKSAGKCR